MAAELQELEERFKSALNSLIETAELSAKLKVQYPEHKKRIDKYWNDFGKHFINRVRKIENEYGGDVLSGFPLASFFKFIK